MKALLIFLLVSGELFAQRLPGPDEAVTEESYHAILDRGTALFGPFIAGSGNILSLERNWRDSSITSFVTNERPPVFRIVIPGGAFRVYGMTNDGLAFTFCHELGHVFGGEPKRSAGYWPSIEGQANYAASNLCLRRLFAGDDNVAIVARLRVPARVRTLCEAAYADAGEAALCQRSALAGAVFAEWYRQLKLHSREYRQVFPAVNFSRPDPTQVRETHTAYSSPQCIFDTALAGALCPRGQRWDLSSTALNQELSCEGRDALSAQRPRCWYKP
jgi:hypothetical protein